MATKERPSHTDVGLTIWSQAYGHESRCPLFGYLVATEWPSQEGDDLVWYPDLDSALAHLDRHAAAWGGSREPGARYVTTTCRGQDTYLSVHGV